ncbi:MAG: NAD-dependent epimerase/dehydratase family protein [Betaproteobacteria bacterium]
MSAAWTVAVTGANGFIGRHLVDLLRARAYRVRPLVRRADPSVPDAGLTGDLAGDVAWPSLLQGVDCVVHCAGMAHVALHSAEDHALAEQTNTGATRTLARAAAAAGVQQFIYLSSAKVMGERSGAQPWTEDDPPAPADPYARSKAAAEAALAEVAGATDLCVTVLRPPLVYGPGVRANFLRLLALADSRWPLPLGSAHAPRSMVYVGNLVDAIAACIGRRDACGQTFFVTDGQDMTVADLLRRLRTCLDRPARLLPCPAALLQLAAATAGRTDDLARLLAPARCTSQRLQQRLGWTPPVPLAQALRITTDWYRDHGRSAR